MSAGALLSEDLLERAKYSRDASHYLLRPVAVARPRTEGEVRELLVRLQAEGRPFTFRSGGTSLSGQAVTDQVLIDTRRHFDAIEVLDDGRRVRAQPGASLRLVNARLRRHGRRLGPDPASEVACTVGGVLANNSSGMTCGTHANAYATVESLRLVLADGTCVDTALGAGELRAEAPVLHDRIEVLRDRVRRSPDALAEIRRQFAMKNTMGYSLNAFADFDSPEAITTHLVVGSEGTLAFVSEAVLHTVEVLPHTATGMLLFGGIADATVSLPQLRASGVRVLELLDRQCLTATDVGRELLRLRPDTGCALLVEYQERTATELRARLDAALEMVVALPCATPGFFEGGTESARYWQARKGILPSVASAKPSGETSLLEDIVFPAESLSRGTEDLLALLRAYDYHSAAVFGHALDANLHFLATQSFSTASDVDRYRAFTDELVDLVLGLGGSLKAEHGTGRVMAPFVRRQFGEELYDLMADVKTSFDPHGLMNPGVILTEDPELHLKHLKTTDPVDDTVDACIECGFCETVCPSRGLTSTPRQRIVLERELVAGRLPVGRPDVAAALVFEQIETCAVDGMCATVCPVGINTGDLVRRKREEAAGPVTARVAELAAHRWGLALRAIRTGLRLAAIRPAWAGAAGRRVQRRLPARMVPTDIAALPRAARGRPRAGSPGDPVAVYFPSCLQDVFDAPGMGVQRAFLSLCRKAGVGVVVPPRVGDLCCGMPWSSKGLGAGRDAMTSKVAGLLAGPELAGLPVVVDATSCTHGLERTLAGRPAGVLDAVVFVRAFVMPALEVTGRVDRVVLHPTCAGEQLGIEPAMRELAGLIAEDVVVATSWGCCGFAGDRGFLVPELTSSATAAEVAEIEAVDAAYYVSVNQPCELGMSRATGRTFIHLLEALDRHTRPGVRP